MNVITKRCLADKLLKSVGIFITCLQTDTAIIGLNDDANDIRTELSKLSVKPSDVMKLPINKPITPVTPNKSTLTSLKIAGRNTHAT